MKFSAHLIFLSIIICFIQSVSLFGQEKSQDLYEQYFKNAEAYCTNSDYRSAIQEYKKALDSKNTIDLIHANYSIAFCYQIIEDYSNALTYYEAVLNYDPGNLNALANAGTLYLFLNTKVSRGLEYLLKSDKLGIEDSAVFYNIACYYAKNSNPDSAVKYLDLSIYHYFTNTEDLNNRFEKIKNDPELANIHDEALYRNLFSHQKELLSAMKTYTKALDKEKQSDHKAAIGLLEKSIRGFSTSLEDDSYWMTRIYGDLGNIYFKMGKLDEALKYNQKALNLFETRFGTDRFDSAPVYGNIANICRLKERYPESVSNYSRALELLTNSLNSDPVTTGSYLNNSALCRNILGEYQKASEEFLKALEYYKSALPQNHPYFGITYYNLALAYSSLEQYQKAEKYLFKALNNYEVNSNPDTTKIHYQLCIAERQTGKFNRSITYGGKVLTAWANKTKGDSSSLAICSVNIGQSFAGMGEYKDAVLYYQKALDYFRIKSDRESPETASLFNDFGSAYLFMDKPETALKYFSKSLDIRKSISGENHPAVGECYFYIGNVYFRQGRNARALDYYKKAIEIFDHDPDVKNLPLALVYDHAGQACSAMGNDNLALEYYNYGLSALPRQAKPDYQLQSKLLSSIGASYYKQESYAQALGLYNRSFSVYTNQAAGQSQPSALSGYYLNIGSAYLAMNQLDSALTNYNNSLSILTQKNPSRNPDIADACNNIAKIYIAKGSYQQAKEYSTRSIQITESNLRSLKGNIREKTRYFELFQAGCQCLITSLYHLGEYDACFNALELSKSRGLLDTLSLDSIFTARDIDQKLRLELQRIREQINTLDNVIAQKEKIALDTADENNKLVNLNSDMDKTVSRIYLRYPKYKDLSKSKPVTLKEAQSLISKDTALVEYNIYEGFEPLIFVITRNGMEIIPVTNQAGFDIDNYREILKYPANGKKQYAPALNTREADLDENLESNASAGRIMDYDSARKRLNQQLLDTFINPILPAVQGKKNLIISASGVLSYIPLEAVQMEDSSYLVEHYNISYIQSASVLNKIRRTDKAWYPKDLIAFGDAIYNASASSSGKDSTPNGLSVSNMPAVISNQNTYLAELAESGNFPAAITARGGFYIGDLSGSLEEVVSLGDLYKGKKKDIITNYSVNEDNLYRMNKSGTLRQYRMIHFSTHEIADPAVPELSSIILSQTNEIRKYLEIQGKGRAVYDKMELSNDGFLSMGEILELDLNCDLVTLSACETGPGSLNDNSIAELGQSFILAGAKGVNVSLWQVRDEATKEFMISYYKKIKSGKNYKEALNKTKREFIKNGKFDHPYFWSSFIYYGY